MKIANNTSNNGSLITERNESTETIRSAKQSRVWTYFERIYGPHGLRAKCLVGDCGQVLSTPLHSTSTLIRHLRDAHELDEFKSKEKLVYRSKQKHMPVKLKKKLDRALITTIIEDERSFGDFLKSGFQKFIQLTLPGDKPPHWNFVSTQLKRLHTKHFFIMINSLSKLLSISVSTDFWYDKKGISFLVFDKVTSITCDSAPNMIKMFDYFSRSDIIRIRYHAHLLHLIVCNGLGLWVEKNGKTTATANETNPHDSELRLSDSLQKINIIDDEQLMNEVHAIENDDSEEDDINQNDNGDNFSDEDDSISINSESDIESLDDSYQDIFEVDVDVNPNESSDLSLPQPDPRICLTIDKSRQLIDSIKDSSILSSFIKKKKNEYNEYND
ncbi:unnamed protein product, partial [Rotaria sordida]